jgi:hypothetical protein
MSKIAAVATQSRPSAAEYRLKRPVKIDSPRPPASISDFATVGSQRGYSAAMNRQDGG